MLVFKLIRELLRNVVKHSGVRKASVTVSQTASELRVIVEDHGVGFEWQLSLFEARSEGFGLWSVADRVRAAAGEMSVDTAPGRGCRVSVVFPHNPVFRCFNPARRALKAKMRRIAEAPAAPVRDPTNRLRTSSSPDAATCAGRFAALIVTLHDAELIESQALVKDSRCLVVRAQFEIDAQHPGLDGGRGQPAHELPSKPLAAMRRRHGEQIQVGDIVAEMHYGEGCDAALAAGDHHRGFGPGDEMLHAGGRPGPGQPLFDQIARHLRNFTRIAPRGPARVWQVPTSRSPIPWRSGLDRRRRPLRQSGRAAGRRCKSS